ncbi:MAG: hypothetical protein GPJ54_20100 [Candidatus Heimdallarchaeota archaeon]|nr:hypothetical protein [Candidatus Heimdallarchaeota archaeon]
MSSQGLFGMVKQKILVISSCGKKKSISVDDQPTWDDLNTNRKRNSLLTSNSESLIPAVELYTGPQSKAIKKAVKILRSVATVDYYIISAGFGLVGENTLLPPYESTFSNKRISEIKAMSEILEIQKSLIQLPERYDLIYLALGKDYLRTIEDLGIFRNKGNEIIYFQNLKDYGQSPFYPIDISILIGNDKISLITYRIGSYTESKGTLLVNYARYLEKKEKFSSFESYWIQVLNQFDNDMNVQLKSNINLNNNPTIKTEIPYLIRGQYYLVTQ